MNHPRHQKITLPAWLPGLVLWGLCNSTQAQQRQPVSEVVPLLVQAARQGQAHGVLVGVGAQAIARRFGTHSPIEIDVQRLHELPTPGCARLEVTTRQQGVPEPDGPRDQTLVYQISYCANGRFPPER
jgi:hypothetical protein